MLAITAEQRDALYGQLLVHLSGIGDELLAAVGSDYQAAERLGREYNDDLRLILDDLGWGEGRPEEVALTTPPDVLRRVLDRIREVAILAGKQARLDQAEAEGRKRESEFVRQTCDEILGRLGPGAS